MYSPAGWRVSRAPLGACLLSRPEVKVGQWTRCFRTLCWKPRHAGSTSTMRPSFGNMSPEGRNNVVQEFWRGQYSSQMIWFNWPRGLWLFSSRGRYIILPRSLAREQKHVTLKINYLNFLVFAFEMYLQYPWRRKCTISVVKIAMLIVYNYEGSN